MDNIIRLPIAHRITAVEDPVLTLRKAINACVKARGEKTTALVIAQAFEIPDTFDWRARSRHLMETK